MSLLLFDIDGTLLLSGGAGVRAMTRAFDQTFRVKDAFQAADVAGRTDTFIVSTALRQAGLEDTPEAHGRFREAYVPLLSDEIRKPPTGRTGLMPGVDRLLEVLVSDDGFEIGLLTGNFEAAAYVKLRHFAIDAHFTWGAFGEESADRNDVARAALRRAEERNIPRHRRQRAVVVGDTPHDVACARAIGARVIAVATGNYTEAQLRSEGADLTLPDLADTGRVLDLLRRL